MVTPEEWDKRKPLLRRVTAGCWTHLLAGRTIVWGWETRGEKIYLTNTGKGVTVLCHSLKLTPFSSPHRNSTLGHRLYCPRGPGKSQQSCPPRKTSFRSAPTPGCAARTTPRLWPACPSRWRQTLAARPSPSARSWNRTSTRVRWRRRTASPRSPGPPRPQIPLKITNCGWRRALLPWRGTSPRRNWLRWTRLWTPWLSGRCSQDNCLLWRRTCPLPGTTPAYGKFLEINFPPCGGNWVPENCPKGNRPLIAGGGRKTRLGLPWVGPALLLPLWLRWSLLLSTSCCCQRETATPPQE